MCSIRSSGNRNRVKNHVFKSYCLLSKAIFLPYLSVATYERRGWDLIEPCLAHLSRPIFLEFSGERQSITVARWPPAAQSRMSVWVTQLVTGSHCLFFACPHPALNNGFWKPKWSLEPFHSFSSLHTVSCPQEAARGIQVLGPPCSCNFPIIFLFLTTVLPPLLSDMVNLVEKLFQWC